MSGNVVVTPTGNPHALDSRRKRNPHDDLDLDQTIARIAQQQGATVEQLRRQLTQVPPGRRTSQA